MKPSFRRYRIQTKEAPSRVTLPSRFLVKRFNNCTNLQECVQTCIYGVHTVGEDGQIAEPIHTLCRGCHLCVLACPKGAITIAVNPEFKRMGDQYFTPQRIETIQFEAETGRVPVSGTGYGGLFAGRGFDGIWFDFSEIVRPTRDGIHGREYISTSVDLGRKLPHLKFDGNRKLISEPPANVEIPIPIILDSPLDSSTVTSVNIAIAKAAAELGTFAIIEGGDYSSDLAAYRSHIIPRMEMREIDGFRPLLKASRIVEIDVDSDDATTCLGTIKEKNPTILVSIRLSYDDNTAERALAYAKAGTDIIHLSIDDSVIQQDPDIARDAIYSVHSTLVDANIRDCTTLVFSGGAAEAAHISKSLILGADAVSLGMAYQIALGCKVCYGKRHASDCRIWVNDEDADLAAQRIVNLVGSWRDQLLEVLGGMGLREARRQRGEVGRAIFYESLEMSIFGGRP